MLEHLPAVHFRERVFRFGNSLDVGRYPDIERLDSWQIRELAELLQRDKLLSLDGFLSAPFDRPSRGSSRFTDGTFGVYYSALDRETARIEAEDFYRKIVVDGATSQRVAYYRCISCQFDGDVLDLRWLLDRFPYLITDSGKEECRRLAGEARQSGADGLVTPSAARARRSEEGTCLPTFNRRALSAPDEEPAEKFVFEPLAPLA